MATSQRLLGFAIFWLLVGGIVTVLLKEPADLSIGEPPTTSPTPSVTETFTFPGPIPTESETPLFPTETAAGTASPTGPEVSPDGELPRTGGGSLAWAAVATLGMAGAAGLLVRRAARSAEPSGRS